MRACMMLMVVLAGCGRSDIGEAMTTQTTPQPVVSCKSTCTSSPSGIATPLNLSAGRPLHWQTCAGCVRVSYDAALTPAEALELSAAVKAWKAAAGDSLCLSMDMTASAPLSDTDRQRIFVKHADPRADQSSLTSITFDRATGQMLRVLVEFGADLPVDRQFAAEFGRALGLDTGTEGQSAVTRSSMGLTTPGPGDQTTLRAMYGDKPWCSPR
ncbi:MAG: hypothetical protein ABTQ32_16865 [Myxococcaceae bacterium]